MAWETGPVAATANKLGKGGVDQNSVIQFRCIIDFPIGKTIVYVGYDNITFHADLMLSDFTSRNYKSPKWLISHLAWTNPTGISYQGP